MEVSIRSVSHTELEALVPGLVEVLADAVNAGSALGFLAPLDAELARDYWLSLRPELKAGSRLLMVAFAEGRLVGAGQLAIPPWATARHRVELQKLFVAGTLRGRRIGTALVTALHDWAWQHGRSLVMLNTRRGSLAEGFYRTLGYREVGVVPGYSVGSAGERYDTLQLYQELWLPELLAS